METMVPQLSFDEVVSSLVYTIHGLNRFGVTEWYSALKTTSVFRRSCPVYFPSGRRSNIMGAIMAMAACEPTLE
jgi:hypothetical protein